MKGSKARLLEHLEKNRTITSMEAFQMFGITRLSARIFDLRHLGYIIDTVMIEDTNRYGESVRFAQYVYRGKKEDS